MSGSNATYDLIGKRHAALAEKIRENAWRIAWGMTAGLVIRIDGEPVRLQFQILSELQEEVEKEIPA